MTDNFKQPNTCVSGIFNGQRVRREEEEIVPESFPELMKAITHQIQKVSQTSSPRNIKKTTQKQRAIRLFKTTNEERILKAVREQNIYFI